MKPFGFAFGVVLLVSPLPAQERPPVELSLGAGVFELSFGDGVTVLRLGTSSQFEVGIPVSDKVAVEPGLSFGITASDRADLYSVGLTFGVPFFLDTQSKGAYIEPMVFLNWTRLSGGGESTSNTNFGLGSFFGIKYELAPAVSLRTEIGISATVTETTSVNLGGAVGFSIFL